MHARLCSLPEVWAERLSDPAPQAAEAGAKEKRSVTPAMTLAHMTQLIMPQHANSLGITFGGQVGHAVHEHHLCSSSA